MRHVAGILCVLATLAQTPASAQVAAPELERRIPAPLPPPQRAPQILGPLAPGAPVKPAPPPRRLDTFGDRAARCLDEAAIAARTLEERQALNQMCVNAPR